MLDIQNMSKTRKEVLSFVAKEASEEDLIKVKRILVRPNNHSDVIPQHIWEKYNKLKGKTDGPVALFGNSDKSDDDIKWCGYVEKLSTFSYQVPNIPENAGDKEIYNTILEACINNDMPLDFCSKITSILLKYLKTGQSPPIILDGPPGCGKTESFKLICGIIDMALHFIPATAIRHGRGIYGDDKNYKSADIGNFVSGIIQTEVLNPVMLIDEIDKAVDIRDDISLEDELLPLFNSNDRMVTDNFLAFPISFKNSLFVFTCNDLDALSEPFIDRCKVIHFEHTEEERMQNIIRKYANKEVSLYRESLELNLPALYDAIALLYKSEIYSIRKHKELFESAREKAYAQYLMSSSAAPVRIDKTHYDQAVVEILQSKHLKTAKKIGF